MASTLVQRICQPLDSQVKIPIHAFIAAVRMFIKGQASAAAIIAFFNLTAGEQTDMNTIVNKINLATPPTGYPIMDAWMYLLICEENYITVAQANALLLIP